MYLKKDKIGGFINTYYWSSTETLRTSAWLLYFDGGEASNSVKNLGYRVRAVRSSK